MKPDGITQAFIKGREKLGGGDPRLNAVLSMTKALDFAASKHTDQRRKGAREEPYINHLAEVAR